MKIISGKTFTSARWSSIPNEIIVTIAGKISSVDDYVRFSAVCRSWYTLAVNLNPKPYFDPLFVSGTDPDSNVITFRNPSSGATLRVPSAFGKRLCFWGSPFGWLVAYDIDDHNLFEFDGELCLSLRYYYFNCSVTNEFKIFKIDLSTGGLTELRSLGDCCLFLGNNYSFACKASYPRDRVFERGGFSCSELASSYVFFSYRHYWPVSCYYNRPFDVEVWDMARSRKVCGKRDDRNPLCESLWILPYMKFRKLED